MHPELLPPHEPMILSRELPPVGGKLGGAPEDFQVDELPLYPFAGEGEHWLVRVRKRCWTSPDMIAAVARAARVASKDIGSAGMKDKHAVTTQWISLPAKARAPSEWELPDGIEVVETTRHTNKLRTGHLLGNRFNLRLEQVEADGEERARRICALLSAQGLPNYFGAQRFGRGGGNVGKAMQWLRSMASGRRGRDRFQQKLYPSVLQSEIFNRYLTLRLSLGTDRLVLGEVVRLAGTGSHFTVEDVEREQPRLEAKDLCLTGPMIGPRMKAAASEALELEARAMAELELTAAELEALGASAPGTRRDLLVLPEGLEVETSGPHELRIAFALPAGSYATQLLRELTRAPFLELRD